MKSETQYTVATKYIIVARFEVEGVVEKPDVIGAIFGQTEGLFGPDLDLRELQKSARIGRIEIQLESKQDRTYGTITIPSSLDKVSTAIIAAAIESVDRIGPCAARVMLEKLTDVREEKRRAIMDKAKEILRKWVIESSPSTDEIVREVSEVIRSADLVEFGEDKLPAGPEVAQNGSIIVVEGRADVINLLRCGIKNAIGLEGTNISKTIIELCKNKEVTAFLDGDRGGDLILKELMQVADIDYVARAPPGKEVEELTPKELMKALREKVPLEKVRGGSVPLLVTAGLPEAVISKARELQGTLEAILFDASASEITRIPVSELASKLPDVPDVDTLLFDGVITQRILDMAEEKKIRFVIGDRVAETIKRPPTVKILTISEILKP
jgi:DNA primase